MLSSLQLPYFRFKHKYNRRKEEGKREKREKREKKKKKKKKKKVYRIERGRVNENKYNVFLSAQSG